jgi:hypothetical protein
MKFMNFKLTRQQLFLAIILILGIVILLANYVFKWNIYEGLNDEDKLLKRIDSNIELIKKYRIRFLNPRLERLENRIKSDKTYIKEYNNEIYNFNNSFLIPAFKLILDDISLNYNVKQITELENNITDNKTKITQLTNDIKNSITLINVNQTTISTLRKNTDSVEIKNLLETNKNLQQQFDRIIKQIIKHCQTKLIQIIQQLIHYDKIRIVMKLKN